MPVKILAVGNPLRSDDAIALRIADEISEFKIIKAEQTPENFVSEDDDVVFIDAADFGAAPGEVKMMPPEFIEHMHISTHNVSELVLKTANKATVIGIQPVNTDFGEELSPELKEKIPQIKEKVVGLLRTLI